MTDTREKIPMFVTDEDIIRRFPETGHMIVDELDRNTATQKGLAGVPFDKRPRESVEKHMRARGHLGANETL